MRVLALPSPTPALLAKFRAAVPGWGSAGCWLWARGRNGDGYGVLHIDGRLYRAHRLAWHWFAADDYHDHALILHTCDTPACVRPDHLRAGTQAANMADMARKSRDAGKLTEPQRRRIETDPRPQRTIAAHYDVSQAAVWYIKHRRNHVVF